jgi:membrane protease YdiL (CAAX protease family)
MSNVRLSGLQATALFFVMAYSISWAAWIALFTLRLSHLADVGLCLYLVAVLAPHASAIIVTALERGRLGLRDFYRLVFRSVPILSVIVAITVPPMVYLSRQASAIVLQLPHDSFFHEPPRTLALLIFGQSAVALGEEPGWRGFALPRLTEKLGPIAGTLILGILWALWHAPLFVIAGTAQYGTPFVPFLITLVAWSMVVTLIVTRTRGSIVVAMLFHASANLCDFTMWQPNAWLPALGPWIVAAAVAIWFMRGDRRTKDAGYCR